MNILNENEQNAIIDALKYTSDVVSALTIKINNQDEEIIYLKKKVSFLEEEINKIIQKNLSKSEKVKKYSNVELNTDESELNVNQDDKLKKNSDDKKEMIKMEENNNSEDEIKSKNFEVTSIGETEINKLRKIKAGQLVDKLVDKLIQKKNEINEINNIIEQEIDKNENDENNEILKKEEKKVEEVVITRRRNKIMRRF